MQTLLNNLNGDALFRSMFAKGTKQTLETLSADFALHAKALTRSKDLLAQDIENVDKSIAELRRKGESLKRDLNTRFNINNLSKEGVETIIAELDFKKENLADIALAGNVEVAEAMFNDVVHTALVNYLKSKFTDIDSQIIKECQSVLGQFDGSILSGEENLSFSEQVVNAFTSKTNLAQAFRQVNKPDSSTLSTVMSAPVWGLLDKGFSSIPLPQIKILKEVVMGIKFLLKEFLPGILTDLLSKFKRGSIRSKMIENIATTVYPSLRANLSKALESLLQEQISKKVVNVFTAFENTVEDKRAVLEQSMSAQREELIQTSKQVEILEVKAQKAKSLAAEIK